MDAGSCGCPGACKQHPDVAAALALHDAAADAWDEAHGQPPRSTRAKTAREKAIAQGDELQLAKHREARRSRPRAQRDAADGPDLARLEWVGMRLEAAAGELEARVQRVGYESLFSRAQLAWLEAHAAGDEGVPDVVRRLVRAGAAALAGRALERQPYARREERHEPQIEVPESEIDYVTNPGDDDLALPDDETPADDLAVLSHGIK